MLHSIRRRLGLGSDPARELRGAKKIQSPLMIPNNKGRGLTTGNLLWLRKVRFIDFSHGHLLASECATLSYTNQIASSRQLATADWRRPMYPS